MSELILNIRNGKHGILAIFIP